MSKKTKSVLTAREREVANLVMQGHNNRVIGEILGIAPKTVSSILRPVFWKTGAKNRLQLAVKMASECSRLLP